MLKTLTATAIAALITAPLAFAGTKTIDVGSFDVIEARGAMNVIYTAGPTPSVVIESDGNDFSDADISVDGDALVITRVSLKKRGLFGGSGNLKVSDGGKTVRVNGMTVPYYTVRVTSPDLSGIKVAQSSTGDASGINAASFKARASSSAKLKLAGKAARAELGASSSADIEAKNFETGSLEVSASSSGDVEALVTSTGQVEISASSSGEVSLRSTQAATFSVNASSGADVELAGACASISITASSGSDVDASELKCETATANASSGADIDAFASVSATGNASSGSDIRFHGSPAQQQANKSSGGDVTFK
ncbi:MAG: GIN domain-containing protein [Hyphomonas sp.]